MLVLQAKERTVEQIRAKRRRYRSYKDQWRSWRERVQAYQQGVEEDMAFERRYQVWREERAKELEYRKMQEILHNQEWVKQVQQSYGTTEAQSRESDLGILLLPSVSSTPHPQVHANSTATEETVIASDIQQLEDECDKALRDALLYRNLAEQLRKEKRDMHHEMSKQCESIRDFW